MVENPVSSPCVRNCCLDGDDVCLGCGRHLEEIKSWQAASDDRRREILVVALERMNSVNESIRNLLNNFYAGCIE